MQMSWVFFFFFLFKIIANCGIVSLDIQISKLSPIFNSGVLNNSSRNISFDCDNCKMGKSKTLSFPASTSFSTECFELVHSDVQGIAPNLSHAHYKYYATFIDDYSQFTWIYFLHSKADVFNVFKIFLSYVENQFSKCIKILCSDQGGICFNGFSKFLTAKGYYFLKICPYTPQQNG